MSSGHRFQPGRATTASGSGSYRWPGSRTAIYLKAVPSVDVSNAARAARILDAAGKDRSALLVVAIHFRRAGDPLDDLRGARLRYAPLCDAPA
jgi:hypothetical protein